MTKYYFFTLALLIFTSILSAQSTTAYNTGSFKDFNAQNHQWEIGAHAGHFFVSGNVDYIPGYGGGIHIRRATDYIFSLRLDLMYGIANGEDVGNVRGFKNTWYSGSLLAVASLNNLKWSSGERKSNFYAFAGGGVNQFKVEIENNGEVVENIEEALSSHAELGGGIAFRVSNKVNIGIEHKFSFVFGDRSDLPDGVQTFTIGDEKRTTFRDVLHLTSVRLNFNLGRKSDSEPLYWVNPLDTIFAQVENLKASTPVAAAGSGQKDTIVIVERITEEGAPATDVMAEVEKMLEARLAQNNQGDNSNTITDAQLQELQRSLEQKILEIQRSNNTSNNNGTPNTTTVTGVQMAEVEQLLDKRLAQLQAQNTQVVTAPAPAPGVQKEEVMNEVERLLEERLRKLESSGGVGATSVSNTGTTYAFFPNIYFNSGSSRIRSSDYVALAGLAQAMQENPGMRLVVTGYADKSGSTDLNNILSYKRAKSTVDHMVKKYGLGRNRFIVQWRGEDQQIISDGHPVNRRVGFSLATNQLEMAPPPGYFGK